MKKLIIGFVIGVLLTIPVMLVIDTPTAAPEPQVIYVEPTPMPTPTPQVIYKERLTDLEQVVANTKDSCVMIYAHQPNGAIEQGSGWVYNGFIITAKHVVEGSKQIDIFKDDSLNGIPAEIEHLDLTLDVAILRVYDTLPSVELGDSDKLIEGEKLVSITSPEGIKNVIEECTFAGEGINELNISDTITLAGSSGGAVFNYNSEIVGMIYGGYEGLSGAIPINQIKSTLRKIE